MTTVVMNSDMLTRGNRLRCTVMLARLLTKVGVFPHDKYVGIMARILVDPELTESFECVEEV
jgi:hypothetical protein